MEGIFHETQWLTSSGSIQRVCNYALRVTTVGGCLVHSWRRSLKFVVVIIIIIIIIIKWHWCSHITCRTGNLYRKKYIAKLTTNAHCFFVGLCPALKKYLALKKQDILKKKKKEKKKKERANHSLQGETAKLTNPNRTKQTTIITQTTLPFIKKSDPSDRPVFF
jgi:hypothetical protein